MVISARFHKPSQQSVKILLSYNNIFQKLFLVGPQCFSFELKLHFIDLFGGLFTKPTIFMNPEEEIFSGETPVLI